MRILNLPALWLAPIVVALTACGGGDPEINDGVVLADGADRAVALAVSSPLPSDSQRIAAATATAQSSTNACAKVQPFYWEVGNRDGAKAAGSVGGSSIKATTPLPYASASKWLYSAYVVQRAQGVLTNSDIQMLTFRSGYTQFRSCEAGQTVDGCLATGSNGQYSAATDGRFFYNGGHMEKHASLVGLGAMTSAGLSTALRSQIGSDVAVSYSQPQPAGGAYGTPAAYAKFLRKMLGGQLRLGAMLGTSSVCTNPASCGTSQALVTPVPLEETWRYSLGHWVESDPVVGDGAFSSAGAFGFYPWIDASRANYGILARVAPSGAGLGSVACGRLIRKAWATGAAQQATATSPAAPAHPGLGAPAAARRR